MLTVDCPLCTKAATVDAAFTAIACEACGVVVEIAADLSVRLADAA